MSELESPYGIFHSDQTGNAASTDQAHVPAAENIVIQATETAGGGTCDIDVEQQLPGMTTWASRLNYTLALSTSRVDVISAPVGLIRVRTSSNNGTVTVKYGAHYPR
jgi:hypothetical protein